MLFGFCAGAAVLVFIAPMVLQAYAPYNGLRMAAVVGQLYCALLCSDASHRLRSPSPFYARFAASVLLIPSLHSCSDSSSRSPLASVDAGATDATPREDAAANQDASKCDPANPIELWVTTQDAHPTRLHVPAVVNDVQGVLLFDTGSSRTFIATAAGSKDPVADGGTIAIGACSKNVMGRPYAADGTRDLPGLGYFGAEELLSYPFVQLDLLSGHLRRYADTAPDTKGWTSTPFEVVAGSVLVRMQLDGKSLRLLLDTGSPHLLWLGQQGKAGDVKQQTTDANGTLVDLYVGTATAELAAGTPETVTVLRVPSFPYLEQRRAEFGGELDGLLGLSTLGARPLLFDNKLKILFRHL